jgi:hypothetical protein
MTITYLGIATSILTLAVAYLFSGYESAKTLAWIIEASLIFTVYTRFANPWVMLGGIVVQIVGMAQFVLMTPSLPGDIVVYSMVFISSVWNIWILRNISSEKTWSGEIILFISSCIWYGFLITQSLWNNKDIVIISEILLMVYTIVIAHSLKKVYFS